MIKIGNNFLTVLKLKIFNNLLQELFYKTLDPHSQKFVLITFISLTWRIAFKHETQSFVFELIASEK